MSQNYVNPIKEATTKTPIVSKANSSKPTLGCIPPLPTNSNINNNAFIIKRKKDDKINKKTFQTVMEADLLKTLDALAKKSGYSRNEMVNMMIEHCVTNFEIQD